MRALACKKERERERERERVRAGALASVRRVEHLIHFHLLSVFAK